MPKKLKSPKAGRMPPATPSTPPPPSHHPEGTGKNILSFFAFLALLAGVFLLTFHSSLRMARIWLHHDEFERHGLDFTVGGVPAEWGYAAWGGPPDDQPSGKFPWEAPASETPRNIPPVLDHNISGGALVINGVTFQSGIGTHAPGKIAFALDGKFSRFSCGVGLDATSNSRGVIYAVEADGREVLRSPKLNSDADAYPVDVSVSGVHELVLHSVQTDFADTGSNVDWVNLKFTP